MNNIKIDLTPNENEVNEIRNWAINVSSKWSTIIESFYRDELIVAKCKNKIIGYFAYKRLDVIVFISVVEVKEDYKNQGIATLIFDELCKIYNKTEVKAFCLYCSPEESQYFWAKKGFEYYPKNRKDKKIRMFKIIGDVMLPYEKVSDTKYQNYIEIWNSELPKKDDVPKWICELIFRDDSNVLIKSIIFFGDRNWRIRLVINNCVNEMRYKDLDRSNDKESFFYIEEIKKYFCT